jgi:hypothetical protein
MLAPPLQHRSLMAGDRPLWVKRITDLETQHQHQHQHQHNLPCGGGTSNSLALWYTTGLAAAITWLGIGLHVL